MTQSCVDAMTRYGWFLKNCTINVWWPLDDPRCWWQMWWQQNSMVAAKPRTTFNRPLPSARWKWRTYLQSASADCWKECSDVEWMLHWACWAEDFKYTRNNRLATVGRSHWNVWTASITHACTSMCSDIETGHCGQRAATTSSFNLAVHICLPAAFDIGKHKVPSHSHSNGHATPCHATTPHATSQSHWTAENSEQGVTAQATIEDLHMRRQRSKETNTLCGLPEDVHLYIAMTPNTIFIKTTKISYASRQ